MSSSRNFESLLIKSAMREYCWQERFKILDSELGNAVDRYSVAQVRDTIHVLIYDAEIRDRCLWIIVKCICEAQKYGAEKWSINLYKDHVCLIVGSVVVFVLMRERLWVALDTDDSYFNDSSEVWIPDQNPYSSFEVKSGYYSPAHSALWSRMKDGVFRLIQRAAESRERVHPSSRDTYAPYVLAFLREEFPHYIPDPVHW